MCNIGEKWARAVALLRATGHRMGTFLLCYAHIGDVNVSNEFLQYILNDTFGYYNGTLKLHRVLTYVV